MNRLFKKYGFALGVFAVSFVLLFVWRMHCSFYADDYMYSHEFLIDPVLNENYLGERIVGFSQACDSAWVHYMTNNGRLGSLLPFFLLMLSPSITAMLAAFAIGLLPFLILVAAGGLGALRRKLAVILSVGAIWMAFPWSDGMQSFDFLLNYVFSSDMMLTFMILYQRTARLGRGRMCVAVAVGFASAWMHEGAAIPLAAWLFFDLLLKDGDRRRRLMLFAGVVAGLAVVCISPGTLSRLSNTMAAEEAASGPNFAMLLGYRAVLVFFLMAVAAFLLPKWRERVEWRRIFPVGAATAVATAMVLVIGTADRGLWFALLLAMVGVVELLLVLPLKVAVWLKCTVAAIVGVLYLAFMWQIIKWQTTFEEERDAVHAELVSGHGVVYRDLVPENSMPWWTLGIPLDNIYRDWYNLYFEGQAALIEGGIARSSELPLVVPARFEGKPFAEWDAIPGNSGLRGEGHLLLSDRPVDFRSLEFVFGEPTTAMNPLNRAALRLLGGWERKSRATVNVDCFYAGKVGADSVWMLFPAPDKRFFRGRTLRQINLAK